LELKEGAMTTKEEWLKRLEKALTSKTNGDGPMLTFDTI
jgi:hypothetical protein